MALNSQGKTVHAKARLLGELAIDPLIILLMPILSHPGTNGKLFIEL